LQRVAHTERSRHGTLPTGWHPCEQAGGTSAGEDPRAAGSTWLTDWSSDTWARRTDEVCFIGGVHGREWGSPDILVYFGMRLLRAYRDRKGVRLGGKAFTAAQIRRIVETTDVVLFPQVNPDGRRFSMERHPMWRKNRRPAPRGRGPHCVGVDLNRNFPFLWGFDRHFAPGTVQSS
jgi:murein tripeptide amidase MpaA